LEFCLLDNELPYSVLADSKMHGNFAHALRYCSQLKFTYFCTRLKASLSQPRFKFPQAISAAAFCRLYLDFRLKFSNAFKERLDFK